MKLILDHAHGNAVDACLLPGNPERVRVKAGSEARRNVKKRDGNAYIDRSNRFRDELIRKGVLLPLVRDSDRLVFVKDYGFESPGAAAEVILGHNLSSRTRWLDAMSGKSLYDLNSAP